MIDIILPPSGPRPTEPQRKFKTKTYAKKMLEKVLGVKPNTYRILNGRWTKTSDLDKGSIPLKLFTDLLLKSAKDLGLDPETTVISHAAAGNSVAINQRIFTESEEDYLDRYSKYERELADYLRWDNLPSSEKKRMLDLAKKHKKIEQLQKKKNELKNQLNEIAAELESETRNA